MTTTKKVLNRISILILILTSVLFGILIYKQVTSYPRTTETVISTATSETVNAVYSHGVYEVVENNICTGQKFQYFEKGFSAMNGQVVPFTKKGDTAYTRIVTSWCRLV